MTKTNIILVVVAVFAVILAACQPLQDKQPQPPQQQPQPNKTTAKAECTVDTDCSVGGCSGQVCTTAEKASGLITTCEYREEYSCLKLTSCGCVQGKCMWKENEAYSKCLQAYR